MPAMARNIAIIALLALVVVAAPGGGNAADTIIAAISLTFMAAIAFLGYRLYRENQFFLSTLSDWHRGLLYGAIGVVFATFVATDRLWDSGLGTLTWFALLAAGCFAVFYVWSESRRYT
jgi:TRAP-type C4-dicarboxylate transport system permease small subunit